ncbi:hypothetical protein BaRGS_00022195 [Batillaria attramentaria]|uniref:Uncharacterized protein n=1 Tax=Batillaria attramentaria TaxID=370345 RepID=A0ABD0KH94_9CAEN
MYRVSKRPNTEHWGDIVMGEARKVGETTLSVGSGSSVNKIHQHCLCPQSRHGEIKSSALLLGVPAGVRCVRDTNDYMDSTSSKSESVLALPDAGKKKSVA